MNCPNISHPDWISLVDKIGEENAYTEYVRNGDTIPNPDNYNTKEEYEFMLSLSQLDEDLLPGFDTYAAQQEAVDTITSSVLYQRNANNLTLTQAFKKWREALEAVSDNPKFKVLQDNTKELEKLAIDKLERLGLIRKKNLTGISLSKEANQDKGEVVEGISDSGDIEINYWKDEWTFEFDSKSNALREVKQFLAFIPKTIYNKETEEFSTVLNYLSTGAIQLPSYMAYDEVFEDLKGILSDVDNTWEAMHTELAKHQQAKPWINSLLTQQLPLFEQNGGDIEQLKRQFVSVMSSSYSNYGTLLWKENKNLYDFKFIDTDQNSITKTVINNWTENFKQSQLITKDENNNVITHQENANKLVQFIEEAEPDIANSDRILKAVGITLADETRTALYSGQIGALTLKQHYTSPKGLFNLIKNRLKGVDKEAVTSDNEYDLVNPFVDNSTLKALAKYESQHTEYAYSNSLRNGENNTVYSYTFNKALTVKFRRLINDPAFRQRLLNITFTKPIVREGQVIYSTWLNELETNPVFKDFLVIRPFDTLRQQRPGSEGVRISNSADRDHELTKIAMIQNNGRSNKQVGRIINYLLTIPSKTASYAIQGKGITPSLQQRGDNYVIDRATLDALYTTVAAEHNRIIAQQNKTTENAAYNKGAKLFLFHDYLNKNNTPEIWNTDGTIKLPTTLIEGKSVEVIIREKLEENLRQLVDNKIKEWTTLGIVKEGKLVLYDKKYAQKILSKKTSTPEARVTYAAFDYIVNSQLGKFNAHQLVIGDPALYYKNSVKDTWDNISKRLASLIAPGKDLTLNNTNETFTSVKLADKKGSLALNSAQLKKRLEDAGLPYEDITGTDAQEYTTLAEDLYVKYNLGLIPTNIYNDILDKIKKEGDNLILTSKELGFVFQATKPVFSDTRINEQEDVAFEDYIKSSSIPLLPQFTKGLEIDKLRIAMENQGIDRAVYTSGYKVGGKKAVSIFNEEGTIKANIDLASTALNLNRVGFRIQQEVPYDENKEEVVKQSQVSKLLFDGMLEVEEFNYEGKKLNGKALNDIYVNLHKDLYGISRNAVEQKILTNGELDIAKLHKILLEEAINRGYSDAEIQSLALDEQGKFEVAFWANPAANKLESLMTSLYSNNINKQKMHGKSFVLVSEEGIKGKSTGITYVGRSISKKIQEDLLAINLPESKGKEIVSILTTDSETGAQELVDMEAEKGITALKEQYNKVEDLIKCLTS